MKRLSILLAATMCLLGSCVTGAYADHHGFYRGDRDWGRRGFYNNGWGYGNPYWVGRGVYYGRPFGYERHRDFDRGWYRGW